MSMSTTLVGPSCRHVANPCKERDYEELRGTTKDYEGLRGLAIEISQGKDSPGAWLVRGWRARELCIIQEAIGAGSAGPPSHINSNLTPPLQKSSKSSPHPVQEGVSSSWQMHCASL